MPQVSDESAEECRKAVGRLVEIVRHRNESTNRLLDWLRVEYGIAEPSHKLSAALDLDCESFVTEVRKARGKKTSLSLAALRNLRDEHSRTHSLPAKTLGAEALVVERKISDLVNGAYGLTQNEVELMWATAPPRMPIARP